MRKVIYIFLARVKILLYRCSLLNMTVSYKLLPNRIYPIPPIFKIRIFINMIRFKTLLHESALLDKMQIHGVGTLTCKWDTGNTSKASALHATDIQREGDVVTWRTAGKASMAQLVGTSHPKGKQQRYVVKLPVTWRGRTVNAFLALTDRSMHSADILCNLDLMRQLGVSVNLNTGLE